MGPVNQPDAAAQPAETGDEHLHERRQPLPVRIDRHLRPLSPLTAAANKSAASSALNPADARSISPASSARPNARQHLLEPPLALGRQVPAQAGSSRPSARCRAATRRRSRSSAASSPRPPRATAQPAVDRPPARPRPAESPSSCNPLRQLAEDVLLVAELQVERRARKPGLSGDVLHRCPPEPVAPEQRERRAEDPLPGRGKSVPSRHLDKVHTKCQLDKLNTKCQ